MSEQELDDLGAIVPPKQATRQLAAQAMELATSPAFEEACRVLRLKYLAQFRQIEMGDPLFERQCIRVQIAISLIEDIAGQLAILADGKRFEDARIAKVAKGVK